MAVTAPVSLIVTAFAPVADVRRALTPLLRRDCGDTDFAVDRSRRVENAGSADRRWRRSTASSATKHPISTILRAWSRSLPRSRRCPPRDGCSRITTSVTAVSSRRCARWRSHRGAASTSRSIPTTADPLAVLFAEEPGAVVQVAASERAGAIERFTAAGLTVHAIGGPAAHDRIRIDGTARTLLDAPRVDLHRAWSATTHALQRLRDNPESADRGIRPASGYGGSRPVAVADVRSRRGHRCAVHRDGFAAADRDPARARSERSGRDGGGVRSRRLRGDRRAHDRHPHGPPFARRFPRVRRLRRVFLR